MQTGSGPEFDMYSKNAQRGGKTKEELVYAAEERDTLQQWLPTAPLYTP